MPHQPIDAERGSCVVLQRKKRIAGIFSALQAKLNTPAISIRALARMFQLSRTVLQRRWTLLERERLVSGCNEQAALNIACTDGRGGSNRAFTCEQEQLLANIVLDSSPSMTHRQIQNEARKLYNTLHAIKYRTRSSFRTVGAFRASDHFITRFKRRRDLVSHRTAVRNRPRSESSEHNKNANKKIKENEYLDYVTVVHSAILRYGARLVLNMDEAAISKTDPPTTAVVAKNCGHAAIIYTHSSGQKITTMPCISAAGDKLQLCAVLKGTTRRCLRRIENSNCVSLQRVRLYYSAKGWVSSDIMLKWLQDVVQPYTRSSPAALILDSFSAHFAPNVQEAAATINLELIQVPPGATSILQPLDVQYNGTLLNVRKRIWSERKQANPSMEDTPQQAIQRQAIAYATRTKSEGVAAFRKSHLLPVM